MAETRKLDDALARFETAMGQFEAALARRQQKQQREESAEQAAEALRLDRSRMAQELDSMRSKATELLGTN